LLVFWQHHWVQQQLQLIDFQYQVHKTQKIANSYLEIWTREFATVLSQQLIKMLNNWNFDAMMPLFLDADIESQLQHEQLVLLGSRLISLVL
jgi:hypothetical protein